ncbi:Smr/MutS family protein [Thauera linaloolentis]|uniref:Smr protein/MutS2 n=1 Tax=Thauera linaloolentis (strain DSM 12138 / JCM 21573 / CCUG 41526 / CIP 105981 / IAM 15112 / NBRC 102519 / 47Lol) TaxID=1123367 RepID=N6Z6B0_THAL4|nr:Smr/MutS family protein [Thauera linaloolentis]ENO90087.1 Smr protein/MutS2 [Thauera linaloolentis 47Lol = DSM 12138]MCM8565371.1 Smr/MutS family protein [Thauera linaloolentis]
MSRRSRTPSSATAAVPRADGSQPLKAAAGNNPFAGLRKQLQANGDGSPERSPQQPAAKKIRPSRTAGETGAPEPARVADEAELALFHKMVGATTPVRGSNRAEIEHARPAPLPRPRQYGDDEDSTDRAAPAARHDPLSLAYEGVTPLRGTGRVELDTPLRHGARLSAQDKAPQAQRPDALILPADTGLDDPASLFRSVVGDTRPVDTCNRVELQRPAPHPAPVKREEDERAALGESLAAPLSFEDRLDMGDEAAFLRPGLPRRVLTDLRRGRWVLQGQLDLHGLVRDEARDALAHFLNDSLLQGRRCIRVIHGKGHGSPGKISILKQLSRGWLAQREEILAFCQAGPHDGGAGALLVLLRAQNAARSPNPRT